MTKDEKILRRAVLVANRLGGGGLVGLRQAFEKVGESQVFDSWVAAGPNLPTTAEVIAKALGDGLVTLSAATGRDSHALAQALADLLPKLVDELTPEGSLPLPRAGLLQRWRRFFKQTI